VGENLSSPTAFKGLEEAVEDLVKMLQRFAWCRMYSMIDRLANATSKEIVEQSLYEALRISRSAYDSRRPLCEDGRTVGPYVAGEDSVKAILDLLDKDLQSGLELVRKVAILALTGYARRGGGD